MDRQRVKSRESGRQTVRRLWWMVFGVETGRYVGRRGQIRKGFVQEPCFKFEANELWRNNKGCGFGEFVGWLRLLWLCWREFVLKRRDRQLWLFSWGANEAEISFKHSVLVGV